MRFFVFSAVKPQAAEDVVQDIMKAISRGLENFKGDSKEQFWAWCYTIARNKRADYFSKQASDRLQPLPPDELLQLAESSAQNTPLTPADRHDLEYVLGLLKNSKPDCLEYLWNHYVLGLAHVEIGEAREITPDNVRMKIGRCLEVAQSLVS